MIKNMNKITKTKNMNKNEKYGKNVKTIFTPCHI